MLFVVINFFALLGWNLNLNLIHILCLVV